MSPDMLTIYPYKLRETWVFDDPRTGLKEEAFVCGATEMISRLVSTKRIPRAEQACHKLRHALARRIDLPRRAHAQEDVRPRHDLDAAFGADPGPGQHDDGLHYWAPCSWMGSSPEFSTRRRAAFSREPWIMFSRYSASFRARSAVSR